MRLHSAGVKAFSQRGIPLPLLVKVRLDVIDEGVDLLRLVSMDYQARALVQQHQVFVLIYDVRLGLNRVRKQIVLPGLVKDSSLMYNCRMSPSLETLVPLGPASVDLDALLCECIFAAAAGGSSGRAFGDEAIHPLPGIIFFPMVSLPHLGLPSV